jgi:hypothetical protein
MMDPQTQTQGIAKQAYFFSMFDEHQTQAGLAYEAAIRLFFISLMPYSSLLPFTSRHNKMYILCIITSA